MQVRMQVVTDVTILLYECQRLLIDNELLLEAVAVSGFVIGIRNITDGDALRAMLRTNPVGIRQIDANGG